MSSFTDTQKASIKFYLGYSEVNELGISGPSVTYLNTQLARTDFSSDFIALVAGVLTKLASVETALSDMVGKAKLTQADVLKFNYSGNYRHLLAEGTRLTDQLAGNLGVPIRRNIFLSNQSSSSVSIRSY